MNAESLEGELHRVRAAPAGDAQGVFGPRSLTWQIDRESAIFFGAGRALLLQLAHPWVAAAIEQHSNAFAGAVGRFHRTFSTVFAMVFGTLDQSLHASRRLRRRHASITGQLPWTAGPFANAIPALRWVYATLIETALVAYELILPAVTLQQREQYYRESRLFAGLFGTPKECLPQDWAGFADYFSEAVQSEILNVSDRSRTMARRLLTGADSWVPVPASYQDLTVALLPSPVRRQFGFSFNDEQKRQIDHAVCRDAAIVPAPARAVTIRWAFSALSRVCAIVCGSAAGPQATIQHPVTPFGRGERD